MHMLIAKRTEIGVGDLLQIIDVSAGENQELVAEVIEIRRVPGKPAYLVETRCGERKLVGESQVRRIEDLE